MIDNNLYGKINLKIMYEQAERGSAELFRLSNRPHPFSKAISTIFGDSKNITIRSREEALIYSSLAYDFASLLLRKIQPYYAIPILMQAVNDFYYGPYKRQPMWIGTAFKTSISLVWGNLYHNHSTNLYSLERIADGVAASSIYEQLFCLQTCFMAGIEGVVKVNPDGFSYSGELKQFSFEWNEAFEKRGELHRTLEDSLKTIWKEPTAVVTSLQNILSGQRPSDQIIFKNTIFGEIPFGESIEFWAGLYTRYLLCMNATYLRSKIDTNQIGICVLPSKMIIPQIELDVNILDVLKNSARDLAWEYTWYSPFLRHEKVQNMIVYRPLIPISKNQDLFVTSFHHAGDSLNWFVESSVMGYDFIDSVKLSKEVFGKLVANKFEEKVISIFNDKGFCAGRVNDAGVWENGNGRQLLTNDNEKMPGEIDLLAYNESKRLVVIGECKVLSLSGSPTTIRNIIYKIGDLDSEGFHSKLRRKIQWIENTTYFKKITEGSFVGILILDREFPGMHHKDHIVIDLDNLKNALDAILK
jgi:hypothetical protein